MPSSPTPDYILDQPLTRFPGTTAVDAWGETSLFYNPGQRLPRGVYFATIKQKDGDNDKASQLDRPGVFRLNLGTSKPLFVERFGAPPKRPAKGECVAGPWDFTELDQLTPHPVYGWMSWVSVLNPSAQTLKAIDPLICAAFEKARMAFEKKTAR